MKYKDFDKLVEKWDDKLHGAITFFLFMIFLAILIVVETNIFYALNPSYVP